MGIDWKAEIAKRDERERLSNEAKANGATKFWFYFTEDYCPICGASDIAKQRMYTPRPEDYRDRHNMREVYNYCEG
jgi:hypothetical protein